MFVELQRRVADSQHTFASVDFHDVFNLDSADKYLARRELPAAYPATVAAFNVLCKQFKASRCHMNQSRISVTTADRGEMLQPPQSS